FNLRQDWMRLFSDTRPVWAAAWIDSRAALKDAHAMILNVSDAAKRRQLLFELSDLPVEMQDVAAQNAERLELVEKAKSDPTIDPRLWAIEQRIGWAKKFRTHYDAVAAKAE
ncbi:MAG: hypothetical protein ACREIT_03935, partial [Tepidisphaeraceae bacterium]